MDIFVIVESEFRTLIRVIFENFIGLSFKKRENKIQQILLNISIRFISSLIAIYIFNKINKFKNVKEYVSLVMICIFFYYTLNE